MDEHDKGMLDHAAKWWDTRQGASGEREFYVPLVGLWLDDAATLAHIKRRREYKSTIGGSLATKMMNEEGL